jgi:ferredoxin
MAYVVTKPCLGTLDRSCVEVCPVDCFYRIKKKALNDKYGMPLAPGDEEGMIMIHPDQCINCGACETECPVEAIYEDTGVPSDMKEFVTLPEQELVVLGDDDLDAIRCTSK